MSTRAKGGGPGRFARAMTGMAALVLGASAVMWASSSVPAADRPTPDCRNPVHVPIAVLGDSDSHAYRDGVRGVARGGVYHAVSMNWLEVWARLRPGEIDPGAFATAGVPETIARLSGLLGAPTRTPRKQDFLFNYALSGATCSSLLDDWPRQTDQLVRRITRRPAGWRDGLVILRIGINDLGQVRHVAAWVEDPAAGEDLADACVDAVRRSVDALRAATSARIALVGIAREADGPYEALRQLPPGALANAERVLGRFDYGLEQIAAADPGVAYIDGHDWFRRRFPAGVEAVTVAGLRVFNARSDRPDHLVLADNHAGTIAGGLFLQAFVETINRQFGCGFGAIEDDEIIRLVTPAIPATASSTPGGAP